jgi:hypothetical protein
MAKAKNLTEEQEVLLSFVPKNFQGKQSEKLVYGTLVYCGQCQKEHGFNTVSIGFDTLSEKTGYGRTMLSTVIQLLIKKKWIERVSIGNKILKTNSVFRILNIRKQDSEHRRGVDNQPLTDSEHREILNIRKQDSEHRRGVDNQPLTDSEHRIENSGCMDENPEIVNTKYKYKLKYKYKDQQQTRTREEFENNINERLDKAACLFKEVLKRLSDAEKEIKALKEEIQQLKQEKKQSTSTSESLNSFDRTKLNEEFGTHLETCNNKNKSITERKNALNNLLQLRDSGNLTEKQYNAVCCIEDNFNKEYSALKDYARFGKLYNDFNQQRTDKYEDAEELFRLRDSLIDNPNLEETHKKNVRKYGMDNDYAMTTAKDILQKERERLR